MSWAEIKKAINSNISKSLDVLITEKCNELQSKLNSVYNTVTVAGNIPSVKSVQRGKVNTSGGASITISSVNPSKSILIVQGGAYSSSSPGVAYGTMDTSGTSITLCISSAEKGTCSWQVIEFY